MNEAKLRQRSLLEDADAKPPPKGDQRKSVRTSGATVQLLVAVVEVSVIDDDLVVPTAVCIARVLSDCWQCCAKGAWARSTALRPLVWRVTGETGTHCWSFAGWLMH